jgi:hypothetical protein
LFNHLSSAASLLKCIVEYLFTTFHAFPASSAVSTASSAAGALFLCSFLWWGATCISTPYAAASYRQHRRLWTATAAAAGLLFLLHLLVQLLYGLHLLPTEPHSPAGLGKAPPPAAATAAGVGIPAGSSSSSDVLVAVLEALGLGSVDGMPVGHMLLVSDGAISDPNQSQSNAMALEYACMCRSECSEIPCAAYGNVPQSMPVTHMVLVRKST